MVSGLSLYCGSRCSEVELPCLNCVRCVSWCVRGEIGSWEDGREHERGNKYAGDSTNRNDIDLDVHLACQRSPAADPADVSCSAPSVSVSRRHHYRGWLAACGQQPNPHRRQERRRGYFMIWQFGKACRNASTPARLSAQWNISAACFSISRHRRW